jgi:hypothetical protein
MSEAPGLPPSTRDHPVWVALSRHSIGPDDAALPFGARLARENGWTTAFAARVMEEYRRFAFLAATGMQAVTPSDAVDQAWHLHLTYTRDYWERFCPAVLGRPLHHEPTAGGPAEQHRFHAQYADTLRRYEEAFGVAPPADLWPGAAQRLRRDPRARRVHLDRHWIAPRRAGIAAALLALALIVTLGFT